MKVSITGTHSTGKTTLAELCSQRLGIQFLKGDTTQEIMKQYFPNKGIDELSSEEHWWLENQELLERIMGEKSEKSFVSDGCSINSIAYAKAFLGEEFYAMNNSDRFAKLASENAKEYDYILYLPPEIPLVADGFRKIDQEFRFLVDRILLQELKKFSFYTIKGSLDERLLQIKKLLKSNLH